jgi:outer membrane protein OmpA-like peptidoglycan-associated protein
MLSIGKLGPWCALLALVLLSLGACSKHEEPAPVVALPPPPPPAPPPAPSADDQLKGQLSSLGATASTGGWSVTLSSATFRASKVALSPDERVTLGKIVALLKDNPHLRVQIENYASERGAKARVQEVSQMHANAVLRELTSNGAEEGRIQAQGLVDTSKSSRVEIIFSNAEGEFSPASANPP